MSEQFQVLNSQFSISNSLLALETSVIEGAFSESSSPHAVPSASSSLNFWVQSLQFSPGVVDFELPVDATLFRVGFFRPDGDLGLENFEFAEATAPQALAGQTTQFALGDV